MSKKILLYGHGGSYNHGCEAIVRCTVDFLKRKYPDSYIALSTHFATQDKKFELPVDEYLERDLHYMNFAKENGIEILDAKKTYLSTMNYISPSSLCISIGGDNFCYPNWQRYASIHQKAFSMGATSILWSCSIDPDNINDEMLRILKTHDAITAREQITFDILQEKGLENVIKCSDIAFCLQPEDFPLEHPFIPGNTVAINISPLVMRKEPIAGILSANIETLIQYILKHTDMNIALIPHVTMPMDNDYGVLKSFANRERIILFSDQYNAAQYKYIISQCRFGVFCRTHATIAAYSSFIPSLAIGYSSKAIGIAKDLSLNDYVLPINSFLSPTYLLDKFKHLTKSENDIRKQLSEKIPPYIYNSNKNIDVLFSKF